MRVDKGKGMETRIRLVEKQKLEGERKKKHKITCDSEKTAGKWKYGKRRQGVDAKDT